MAIEPLLSVALILAMGALVTSIGLTLATWFPRQGRAVGLSVAAFGFLNIGWPLLVLALGLGRQSGPFDTTGYLLGAPWYGSHRLLDPLVAMVYRYGGPDREPDLDYGGRSGSPST